MSDQIAHRPAAAVTVSDDILFTATGGAVLLTALVGEVTEEVANNPTSNFTGTVDAGTIIDINHLWRCTDREAYPVGAVLGWDQELSVVSVDNAVTPIPRRPLVLTEGVTVQARFSAAEGAIRWTAVWRPLDEGATLLAS